MSNRLSVKKSKSSRRQQRINWLLEHQSLWEGFPRDRDEQGGQVNRDARYRSIIEAMRTAGVVAQTTYWADVQLLNLINEARRQRRMASIQPTTAETKEKEKDSK